MKILHVNIPKDEEGKGSDIVSMTVEYDVVKPRNILLFWRAPEKYTYTETYFAKYLRYTKDFIEVIDSQGNSPDSDLRRRIENLFKLAVNGVDLTVLHLPYEARSILNL